MQLSRLVDCSRQVADTRSRLAKRALLSQCLREAGHDEIRQVVAYLSGTLPQGRIGVGGAMLRRIAGSAGASVPSLDLREVDTAFQRIAETRAEGSQRARAELLGALFARATPEERSFLIRLILGELRQGALEALLIEAIADAAALPVADVRRAVMLAGEAGSVAEAVLRDGREALSRFRLRALSPVRPMLAESADDMGDALQRFGEAALEYKLDGARVQIHRDGTQVRIFSRQLNDVTNRLPEVVDVIKRLPASRLILDGEVIALREGGRPQPFQVTMSRFGRKSGSAALGAQLPLNVFLFDCLHQDGEDLIDRPAAERFARLGAAARPDLLVPRIVTADPSTAQAFLEAALAKGHEGVMIKSLASFYAAGRRGADWLKLKQATSFDLVVLAAEWGSGRRQGWLSNLHLGARDPGSGTFVMLGKTFKGLTDAMLEWQTARLLELEIGRDQHVVHVQPELVVEIAVNEIQSSSQYPGGMALRFARVKRYRTDKRAEEADTVDAVRALYQRQTGLLAEAAGR